MRNLLLFCLVIFVIGCGAVEPGMKWLGKDPDLRKEQFENEWKKEDYFKALDLSEEGKYFEAVDLYRYLLGEKSPFDPPLTPLGRKIMAKAYAEHWSGNFYRLRDLSLVRKILSWDPQNLKLNEELGRLLREQWRYDEALTQYEKLLSMKPDDNYYLQDIIQLKIMIGRIDEETLGVLRKTFEKQPMGKTIGNVGKYSDYWNYRAFCLALQGKAEEAVKSLKEKTKYDYTFDYIARAGVMAAAGNMDKAFGEFQDAAFAGPLETLSLLRLNPFLKNRFDTEKIRSYLPQQLVWSNSRAHLIKGGNMLAEYLIQRDPKDALAWRVLALYQSDSAKIIEYLNKAISIDPRFGRDAATLVMRGKAQLKQNQWVKAVSDGYEASQVLKKTEKAASEGSTELMAEGFKQHGSLSQVFKIMDQISDAYLAKEYDKLDKLAAQVSSLGGSDIARLSQFRGFADFDRARYKSAREHLSKAIVGCPGDPMSWGMYAKACYWCKEWAECLRAIDNANLLRGGLTHEEMFLMGVATSELEKEKNKNSR